jgi:hypothetical protein
MKSRLRELRKFADADQVEIQMNKKTWENFCAMVADDQRWWAQPWGPSEYVGIDLSRMPERWDEEYKAKDAACILRAVLLQLGLKATACITEEKRKQVLARDGFTPNLKP